MLMFTLAISCLTTFNLPGFMDLTLQVPMQYCSLQHQALLLSPVTSTAVYSLCFGSIPSFFLELFLHWSPVTYWAPTDLGRSSFSILSFCLFILFMGISKQEHWSGFPFPSPVDHIVSDLSTMSTCLGWPHRAWLSFIELDKAVVLVWLDWLVFCDYGFSVSALWCRLATLTVLLGFLLPWMWVISSWLLQQSPATVPYLDEGYLLTAAPRDLERGIAPLGPLAPAQPLLLGHGATPPGRRPWPWVGVAPLGCSCAVPSLALLAAAPDLRCGVAPLGRTLLAIADRASAYILNSLKVSSSYR